VTFPFSASIPPDKWVSGGNESNGHAEDLQQHSAIFFSRALPASGAGPVKHECVAYGPKAFFARRCIQTGIIGACGIAYSAAGKAGKMRVGRRIPVKPDDGTGQLLQPPLFRHPVKIAIDSAQTQPGNFRLQPGKHHLCRGMIHALPHDRVNFLSLKRISLRLHGASFQNLSSNDFYLYDNMRLKRMQAVF